MDEKFYEELKEKIRPYFSESAGHGFDHTERVLKNAINISQGEELDLDIVKTAALLHDIARHKQDLGEIDCHAEEGEKIAKEILNEINFPKNKIDFVCDAIKVHRYSKGLKAETKEAEILQDADRLDALGALTIGRIFAYSGKKGRAMHNPEIEPEEYKHNSSSQTSINHFYEKILKIKPESFHTKKAREIAKGRYEFVEKFVDRFIKEWEGEL